MQTYCFLGSGRTLEVPAAPVNLGCFTAQTGTELNRVQSGSQFGRNNIIGLPRKARGKTCVL